ncbi:hypothetical protein [Paraburkholderia sp. Cpub6]|uniref:hypothetical protein n=1 Tax=Paraburkholderia sp. Cpub6 TaxID=2723094 RepID=UPI00161E7E64|nr:hypothetical protein [Paraburkholderia sp. Cpub6]MBB5463749.1 hypothetical protein [Paraburkholderia sp. Cpub6]
MKAGRRRVVFVKAPAAAPLPILFVKSVTPEPVPLELVPEPDPCFDFGKPMTGHMHDLLCKGLHDGRVSVSDIVRANQAYMCNRPIPHDLIEIVVALA